MEVYTIIFGAILGLGKGDKLHGASSDAKVNRIDTWETDL